MQGQMIEVTPRELGWAVTLRRRIHGVFTESAEAVAYARRLSDKLAQEGESSRICVRFDTTRAAFAE